MKTLIEQYGAIIILSPLLGAAINGLLGRPLRRRFGERPAGLIAVGSVFVSFVVAAAAFVCIVAAKEDSRRVLCYLFNWLNVGTLRADIALLLDPLSAIMALIITGVGLLIHIYSTGYMKGDPGYYRFFSYLNLFVASMLVLVLADNMLVMFIGWEGVGLCSYLLISFWFSEKANALAGNKAFIVNRVGDFGFILGMLLIYSILKEGLMAAGALTGEMPSLLGFGFLAENVRFLGGTEILGIDAVTVICLLLFVGAAGKSAQIPLYVWLPDAMAGPTPVSALIHAATMVTAGVYMIGRLNFLFSMSPAALTVIATVGAATALCAATIGCAQNDIKKVLAYSTVSQLGYMFLGMGVAAYSAGIFHVMTHAFFKACLFLGSGSVILGMHHEQDIRWMGGLRKLMPRTFVTFFIATAAICGLPPFSGFFSKDEILWQAWKTGHYGLWLMGFVAAGLTAFYMTRLLLLTFYGENRLHLRPATLSGHAHCGIKESPSSMTVPLIILAVFSAAAGLAGVPAALGGSDILGRFLGTVLGHPEANSHHSPLEYILMAASVAVAFAGIGAGVLLYRLRPELPGKIVLKIKVLHRLVYHKYYVDEIYELVFVRGAKLLSRAFAAFDRYVIDLLVDMSSYVLRLKAYLSGAFDRRAIDGLVNLIAGGFLFSGGQLRRLQDGRIQFYLLLLLFLVSIGISFAVFM